MSHLVPANLQYTTDHEWARIEGNTAIIGITHHAQSQLGDVVYLELPAVGKKIEQGKIFGVVESVKAVSDLFAPLSGEVLATNADLVSSPEWVNQDPYEKAWMIKIKIQNPAEQKTLLDKAAYESHLEAHVK